MRQTRLSVRVGRRALWPCVAGLAAGLLTVLLPGATETAVANGDTRTLHLYHAHTRERIDATFMVNGQYDPAVLAQLNHFLRDWRNNDQINMSPRLFDVIWEVYRESGSQQPIEVLSAYRSPQTNAMLRRRTRGVAEHSQHILGHAMDQHYMDVPMSRIRELAMKLQRGGVGFYPTSGTPFVHLDVGGVRHWPRMSYEQLSRLFPDGKTVFIPSNGQPLPGYEQARAELEARGDGNYPTATEVKSKGFFAWLFGGGGDEEEDNEQAGVRPSAAPQRVASFNRAAPNQVAVGGYGKNESGGAEGGGFLSRLFSSSAQPVQQAAETPEQPRPAPQVAAAPVEQPSPRAQQQLAQAMVAEQPVAAPAPVAQLPVPARVLNDPDPTRAPGAPLPPRRPVELAALGPDRPIPPTRPSGLSRDPHDAAGAPPPGWTVGPQPVARAGSGLPDVITQGGTGQSRPSSMVLGYAAQPGLTAESERPGSAAVPLPVSRPPGLISAHLDRSNFRNLTRPTSSEKTPSRSALGAVVPPLRAAMRSQASDFVPVPMARPGSFQAGSTALPTNRFSAGKPTAQAATRPSPSLD